MLELRSFVIAAAGTFGLLEVTNSEVLLPTESDPESLVIKTIITVVVGLLSTLLTRLFRNGNKKPVKRKTGISGARNAVPNKRKPRQSSKN